MMKNFVIITLVALFGLNNGYSQDEDPVKSKNDSIDNQVIIEEDFDDNDNDDDEESGIVKHKKRTENFWNLDFGLNNYLQNGKFPDATNESHTVKPWGSWYLALASVNRTRINGPLYMEWGMSFSWYNFKMQDPSIRITKGVDNIEFLPDTNGFDDYIKSKLSVTHINIFLVPMIHTDRSSRSDDKGFRLGVGGYAGYRVGSSTKFVYDKGGKQKDKGRGNYYLNNVRYGIRAQAGWKGTDIFFNYDLNELFAEGKGPELNPFSFGIIF
ncbi:MAG: hypothetical protein OEW75_04895 [Cyclobacteriaceae bacterium]|nr:hypothetical protein [Cyclobacteriaceae bacterium]